MDQETGDLRAGRLGWKADQPSVRGQVASALRTDMGVRRLFIRRPIAGMSRPTVMRRMRPSTTCCWTSWWPTTHCWVSALEGHWTILKRFRESRCSRFGLCWLSCGYIETSPFHPRAELRSQVIHPHTDCSRTTWGKGWQTPWMRRASHRNENATSLGHWVDERCEVERATSMMAVPERWKRPSCGMAERGKRAVMPTRRWMRQTRAHYGPSG